MPSPRSSVSDASSQKHECAFFNVLINQVKAKLPGLLVATLVAGCAGFFSGSFGGPVLIYALLLGMSAQFLSDDTRLTHGMNFASKTVLRCGVAMLGARIVAADLVTLGAEGLVAIAAIVPLSIAGSYAIARWQKLSPDISILSAVAVSICGASAALAVLAALPERRDLERFAMIAVVSVTGLSTIAMAAYPLVGSALGLSSWCTGFFLGASIHDVAQVVGAGYSVSEQTGDAAVLVKLVRVSLLAPVIITVAFMHRREAHPLRDVATRNSVLPWFLVGFFIFAAMSSAGLLSDMSREILSFGARGALIIAIAALGLQTSFKSVFSLGSKPLLVMLLQTALLATLALTSLTILPACQIN